MRLRVAAAVIAAICAVGCKTPDAPIANAPKSEAALIPVTEAAPVSAEPCGEEASNSVLDKLHPILSLPFGDPPTVDVIVRKQFRAKCIREWVDGGGVPDPCIRKNYVEWLDYFDGLYLQKLKEANAPKPAESDSQRYDRERREEVARVQKWEATHHVPQPPEACERSVIQAAK